MKKICLTLALAGGILVPSSSPAQFADAVISYNPGTGFAAGFTNSSAALGTPASGAAITPFAPAFSKTQLVSIGAGGEITLQMSDPIINAPNDPYGINFILFANQFFVSSGGDVSGLFDHAASILVQVSANDSTWYTLNPALAPQPGTLFPTAGNGNPQVAVNPALTLANLDGQNLAGVDALYGGSDGGTGYDLSWAEDASGNSVDLPSADYVRIEVETGVLDLDAVSVVPEAMSTCFALLIAGAGLFWFYARQKKILACLTAGALMAVASSHAATVTFTDNFSTNPLQNGWQIFGDTNLFQWDSTNQNVDVTWDSSQGNSYFYHPLGATVTRNDNFSLAFDLQLTTATANDYGFELAIGFFNLAEATNADFQRSTGTNSPDLVEFDYFPATEYAATVWPLFVDSNSDFNYNGSSDYALYAPNLGDWYHVAMTYSAGSQTMVTTMTNFEQTSGITVIDPIDTNFTDFNVDTLSISSYQDDGYGDSIYAQGVVANFAVNITLLPIANISGAFTNGVWQAQFGTKTNYVYTLERTVNFQCWTNVGPATPGTGMNLILQDPNPPASNAYYRVSATTP